MSYLYCNGFSSSAHLVRLQDKNRTLDLSLNVAPFIQLIGGGQCECNNNLRICKFVFLNVYCFLKSLD